MGFQQGLSGLNTSSKSLEVIGNNVANANTYGAKASRAEFADMYAASLGGGGNNGIGIGARIATVAQQFTQGNITTTSNNLDLAINGRGFFALQTPQGETVYSRNGQFKRDASGYIINNEQHQLLGQALDDTGAPSGPAGSPIRLSNDGSPPLKASAITTVFLFLGYVLQTVGLRYTGASNSAFVTALYVVFVPLILRRFDGRVLLATAIAVIGLWLLVKPTAGVNIGDLLTLGCAVAFAGHIVCLERFTREFDAPSLLIWQMAATTVLLVPATWWEQAPTGSFAPTAVLLIGLGITGGLATGAFAVQMWVQQFVPAQQVALVFASEPAYAAWLSWYFLGETLDLQGWVGSGLILLAVVIGALESRKQPSSGEMTQPT